MEHRTAPNCVFVLLEVTIQNVSRRHSLPLAWSEMCTISIDQYSFKCVGIAKRAAWNTCAHSDARLQPMRVSAEYRNGGGRGRTWHWTKHGQDGPVEWIPEAELPAMSCGTCFLTLSTGAPTFSPSPKTRLSKGPPHQSQEHILVCSCILAQVSIGSSLELFLPSIWGRY